MIPGEYHAASEPIDYNGGYEAISLEVKMWVTVLLKWVLTTIL